MVVVFLRLDRRVRGPVAEAPTATGEAQQSSASNRQVAQALALSVPSGISRAPHEHPFHRPRAV
jgi:hypothetical protein